MKAQDLWACHLGPDLGGKGYGQLKLGADERDPRPVELGAERLRLPGARLGQRRDPRPLRHRRAEGEVPRSRCSTARSSSCYSMTEPQAGSDPAAVHVPGRARRRRVGDQRREVVLVELPLRRVRDRHGGHRSRRVRVPGHVDVPRADRHARHRDHPQRRARGRAPRARARTPTSATTSVRVPGREPARRRGPGVRDRADPARRRAHPPRHAHGRHVPAGVRHDVRARASRAHAGRGARAASRWCRRRSPTRGSQLAAVPAAGAARGVDDRPEATGTRRGTEIAG